MKRIQRLEKTLALIEKGVILLCFWLLVILVLMTILSRNVLHLPSHQWFELGPRLVLWLALFGASAALRQKRHIRLELILRHCPENIRRWSSVIVNGFGAAVMGILLIGSLDFVRNEIAMFGEWGRLTIVFPIFFALASLRYLTDLLVFPGSRQASTDDPGSAS